MASTDGKSGGLVASFKRLLASFVEALENRADLFCIELQEERNKLIIAFILATAGILFFILCLIMLTFTIIKMVPEDFQDLAAFGFCGLYGAGGVVFFFLLKKMLIDGPVPFHDTIEQLKKDKESLKP